MELKRVVVTGLGALTPIGNTLSEYWDGLINGKSGAAMITRYDASAFKTLFACELKGFNADDHFDRKEVRKLDPFSQYAMVAAALCYAVNSLVMKQLTGLPRSRRSKSISAISAAE